MSRHRNFRYDTQSQDLYDDDDDIYDDDYDQSFEEDNYSSSEASFMYDRSCKQTDVSPLLGNIDINKSENGQANETGCDVPDGVVDEVPRTEKPKNFAIGTTLAEDDATNTVEGFTIRKSEPEQGPSRDTVEEFTIRKGELKQETSRVSSPKVTNSSCSPNISISADHRSSSVNRENAETKSRNVPMVKTEPLQASVRYEDGKEHLQMIVIGHVDAGKSTLMGHMLYKLGYVDRKTIQKFEHEAKKIGKQSFVYAWVLDEVDEERDRGVTIDIGKSKFQTASKIVTLLDAPGHKDFIPNMITGATQADVALLVIDATVGEFETGFENGGQTREHTLLVRSLGVSQLAVVINKMDNVSWSEERFNKIRKKLDTFLRQVGFKENDLFYVPCSGLAGQNISERVENSSAAWYTGPTLMEVIDKFRPPVRPLHKPFRLCVNDFCKGVGTASSVAGQVETGHIKIGSKVLVQPLGEVAVVKGLAIDERSETIVYAGSYANIVLANIDLDCINVGNVICDVQYPIPVTTQFEARIVIFNIVLPITMGYTFMFHMLTLTDSVVLREIRAEVHKVTGEIVKKKPRCLLKNTSAIVVIETNRPVCVELYENMKEFGRFMLRDTGVTVAAGLVTERVESYDDEDTNENGQIQLQGWHGYTIRMRRKIVQL